MVPVCCASLFPSSKGYMHCPELSITTACPQGHWKQRGADRHSQIYSLPWICLKTGQKWTLLNRWSPLHFGPAILFSDTFPAAKCANCKWLGKWAGCDTCVQMSLVMTLCSFFAISLALLRSDHTYSNLPCVEAGKHDISSLDWSVTTPP